MAVLTPIQSLGRTQMETAPPLQAGKTWFAPQPDHRARRPSGLSPHNLLRRAARVGEVRAGGAGRVGARPSIGITIAEVYGQTEDCGPTTMNRPGRIRLGTVGEPLPGVEVHIADDGEVLVRGPNVTTGYWNNPEATAELLEDGWMNSGDLGVLEDGYLRIIGRKKDLIVTSSGKNIAPQDMETELQAVPFISQAVVVGDGRKYLTALLALDVGEVRAAIDGHDGPAATEVLATHPLVHEEINRGVERLNANRAPAERIKAWRIPPRELTVADGELTPTLKVKRAVVLEHFAELVEEMYAQ